MLKTLIPLRIPIIRIIFAVPNQNKRQYGKYYHNQEKWEYRLW